VGLLLAGISLVADLPGLGGLSWVPLSVALAWLAADEMHTSGVLLHQTPLTCISAATGR
jgi:hypothetical protein